jgi:uncharacterized damage-inducible protein DinB
VKKIAVLVAGLWLVCGTASAQGQAPAASTPPAQQAPASSLDIAGFLKVQHLTIRRNLAASAEKMPDSDFHFRPQGVAPEVRTFGQIVAHLANANYAICASAKGEPNPAKSLDDAKARQPKAELVKALNEALSYCDAVYDAQTNASVNEMVSRQGRNNVTLQRARGNALINNLAHNNEHYGNLVTYLRAKGIVPPSSE